MFWALVIYSDYRKADYRDSVPHSRLYVKLNKYNINGQIKTWIRDFLKDRKQRVVINGKYSQKEDVTSGIPQGSDLGPLPLSYYLLLTFLTMFRAY